MTMLVGNSNDLYAEILFIAFAAISALLIVVEIAFLQKMKILPAYFIVVASICICYENSILAVGDHINSDSAAAQILFALQALEIPLLIICMFETTFHLYEEKGAPFVLFPDENESNQQGASYITFWFVRFLAVALFVLSILVNFRIIPHQNYDHVGSGGYMYLAKHPDSLPVWLALIPSIILSLIGLITSLMVARYESTCVFMLCGVTENVVLVYFQ